MEKDDPGSPLLCRKTYSGLGMADDYQWSSLHYIPAVSLSHGLQVSRMMFCGTPLDNAIYGKSASFSRNIFATHKRGIWEINEELPSASLVSSERKEIPATE